MEDGRELSHLPIREDRWLGVENGRFLVLEIAKVVRDQKVGPADQGSRQHAGVFPIGRLKGIRAKMNEGIDPLGAGLRQEDKALNRPGHCRHWGAELGRNSLERGYDCLGQHELERNLANPHIPHEADQRLT